MEITDDGLGGADESAGTGFAGLGDRVAALTGTLHLTSPLGGPTVLRLEVSWRVPAVPAYLGG